jgi:hypothetical protein
MVVSTINIHVKFNLLLETWFNKLTALQRVRIKVDPSAIPQADDLSECPSYEGYVLEENDGMVKILVVQPTVGIETLPVSSIEPTDDECEVNILDQLKQFILQQLQLQESDPLFIQIINCSNLDEIETFLQQSGYDEGNIMELYKNFITL